METRKETIEEDARSHLISRLEHSIGDRDIREKVADHVIKHRVLIQDLPPLEDVVQMSLSKMRRVLKFCPESPLFVRKQKYLNCLSRPQAQIQLSKVIISVGMRRKVEVI